MVAERGVQGMAHRQLRMPVAGKVLRLVHLLDRPVTPLVGLLWACLRLEVAAGQWAAGHTGLRVRVRVQVRGREWEVQWVE